MFEYADGIVGGGQPFDPVAAEAEVRKWITAYVEEKD